MSTAEVYAPGLPQEGRGFQKGHPRYGGRRKGSRNRFGGDLRAGSARIRQADVQVKASNRFAWNGSPQTRQNLDFTAICDR
jgi:hypothetical protein